jgi:hypothetical protein
MAGLIAWPFLLSPARLDVTNNHPGILVAFGNQFISHPRARFTKYFVA